MKQIILLILIFIFVSCGENSQKGYNTLRERNTPVKIDSLKFSVTIITVDEYDKAKKSFVNKVLYDTTTIRNENGKFKLPIDKKWKPFVIFTDTLLNTDDSYRRQYNYVGQFKNIGLYIVEGNFWEHSEYYLIDKRTGTQIVTWYKPIISPTDKYIANISMPFGLEGAPNGIQIWRIEKNINNESEPITITKYFELDQQIWVPEEFVWESDYSLLLKVAGIDKYLYGKGEPSANDFYYLRLKIQ